MFLVNKYSGGISRTTIHIFITAPGGKINLPVVKIKLNVTRRMRQVPTYSNPLATGSFGNSLHIKNLTVVIVHATEKDEGQLISNTVYGFKNILSSPEVLSFPFPNLNNGICRIKAVKFNLAIDHILV